MAKRVPVIVYTYGVWDLVHDGHTKLLLQAKKLGDKLVVGVFTDKVAENFKRKPCINEEHRWQLMHDLVELGAIDMVVYQDEFNPQKNIDLIKPDIVAKGDGAGWSKYNIPEYKRCKSILLNYTVGISTSEIIERIKNDNK